MGVEYGWMGAVKTTIEISDDLLLRAKQQALARNTTLRAIVEEALHRALGQATEPVPPLRTVTWGSAGRNSRVLDAKAVRAALAREREGSTDDEYLRKRFGFVEPGSRR